jgi:hypothetical protein
MQAPELKIVPDAELPDATDPELTTAPDSAPPELTTEPEELALLPVLDPAPPASEPW